MSEVTIDSFQLNSRQGQSKTFINSMYMIMSSVLRMSSDLSIWVHKTLCMLHNFLCICCHLLTFTFFKINIFKNSFRNTFRVSNGLDPDQDRHSVGPDHLDQNRLQFI